MYTAADLRRMSLSEFEKAERHVVAQADRESAALRSRSSTIDPSTVHRDESEPETPAQRKPEPDRFDPTPSTVKHQANAPDWPDVPANANTILLRSLLADARQQATAARIETHYLREALRERGVNV